MILQGVFFYLFAVVLLVSALMVIWARNPVHTVLFLILAFVNVACLFILLGAQSLAMLFMLVNIGAVGVLFLFTALMLNIDFSELRRNFSDYVPMGLIVGGVFLVEMLALVMGWTISPDVAAHLGEPAPAVAGISDIEAIGSLLYTQYAFYIETLGLILLVAMIGAILLMQSQRKNSKTLDRSAHR